MPRAAAAAAYRALRAICATALCAAAAAAYRALRGVRRWWVAGQKKEKLKT
jgi:hypothetical protein